MTLSDIAEKPETVTEEVKKPGAEIHEVDAITADLLQDCVRLHLGKGYFKTISYTDFLLTVSNVIGQDKKVGSKTIFHLPQNCYYFSHSETEIDLICYYPECNKVVKYLTHERMSVVPNVIISHVLKMQSGVWKIHDTRYLTTNKPLSEIPRQKIAVGSGVCTLPFTNVYNDGRLCYGNNLRVAEIKPPDFRPLHWYYEMLFTAPFNNDIGVYSLKRESKFKENYAGWFAHLAKLAETGKSFPYAELSL